jgi:hypothetical protein
VTGVQDHVLNALLRFHCKNGYANAAEYYITRTLLILLELSSEHSGQLWLQGKDEFVPVPAMKAYGGVEV